MYILVHLQRDMMPRFKINFEMAKGLTSGSLSQCFFSLSNHRISKSFSEKCPVSIETSNNKTHIQCTRKTPRPKKSNANVCSLESNKFRLHVSFYTFCGYT
jgi:hypothetical protein